ncbi:MAG: glutamate synthase [Opitutales bacterium]
MDTGKGLLGLSPSSFYTGSASVDLSFAWAGRRPATPFGPAAGPHTQLAQNIVLAYLAGARAIELKTVQEKDDLEIPRPCIDAPNLAFNVEWSQELSLEASLEQYVIAWLLLKQVEHSGLLGKPAGDPFYDCVFDLSLGYDYAGLRSAKVGRWLSAMTDASAEIDRLRAALPADLAHLRDLEVDPRIGRSVTLSTFHGCPKDEIEQMAAYLMEEWRLDVIIKLNPTLLGHAETDSLLRARLGYSDLQLNPDSFAADLTLDEAAGLVQRLRQRGADCGQRFGIKFSNTLVVGNHRARFNEREMYLSGRPLHVVAMRASAALRAEVGWEVPVSFSAGIDQANCVEAVAAGFAPVTACTDLLQKGGYARLHSYCQRLGQTIVDSGADNLEAWLGSTEAVQRRAQAYAEALPEDARYHADALRPPRQIGKPLLAFDCLSCGICEAVCPNAALFDMPLEQAPERVVALRLAAGRWQPQRAAAPALKRPRQILVLDDFCNECGHCETQCPMQGHPSAIKHHFFLSQRAWAGRHRRDGFWLETPQRLRGRIDAVECALETQGEHFRFTGPHGSVVLDADGAPRATDQWALADSVTSIELEPFHLLVSLLRSVDEAPPGHARELIHTFGGTPV